MDLVAVAAKADRLAIVGGPHSGKTTLAGRLRDELGRDVRHTDDLIETHDWSEASAQVAEWMADPGPWVIEGVATVRALRKRMLADDGPPADLVLYLGGAKAPRSPRQEGMAKGVDSVMEEIVDELESRGTRFLRVGDGA